MNSLLLLVASTAIGIDIGYQPLETGGLEYIIQFEPQQLESLTQGLDLVSEVPPELDVRRYRIQVGTDKLPHDLGISARKRDAAAQRGPAAKKNRDDAVAEVVDEPTGSEFESTRRGAGAGKSVEELNADDAEGPALVGDPVGPDKTFTSEQPDDAAVSDAADRKLPRKFSPDDEAGPLSAKAVEAAAFADRRRQQDELDDESVNSRSTQKPSLPDNAKSRSRATDADEAEAEKPWMTLVWTIAALCVSLGLNVYLGSIAWTARERYRLLLERTPGEPVEV